MAVNIAFESKGKGKNFKAISEKDFEEHEVGKKNIQKHIDELIKYINAAPNTVENNKKVKELHWIGYIVLKKTDGYRCLSDEEILNLAPQKGKLLDRIYELVNEVKSALNPKKGKPFKGKKGKKATDAPTEEQPAVVTEEQSDVKAEEPAAEPQTQ